MAALVVALIGIGQLVGDLPAGALAARIGEKRALILACCAGLRAPCSVRSWRQSLVLLAVAMFVTGLAYAVFSLARQAYLTEAIPLPMRARALSTLGGTFRIGLFIGPFVAAADRLALRQHRSAYAFAAVMSLAAAVLTAFLPDVTLEHRRAHAAAGEPRIARCVGPGRAPPGAAHPRHRRPDHLGGAGDPAAIVPLWAEVEGIDAATTSVIFGISAGVDMLLFYPGRRDHGPVRAGLRRRAGHDHSRRRLRAVAADLTPAGRRGGGGPDGSRQRHLRRHRDDPRSRRRRRATAGPSSSAAGGCAATSATPAGRW